MTAALDRLASQLTAGWSLFPEREALDALLTEALARAADAPPEHLTVASPVSRPKRLRLAVLCGPASLDSFYSGEQAELSVSDDGRCYLVYRRADGGDYALEWSSATALPTALSERCPDVLARAMFDGDN